MREDDKFISRSPVENGPKGDGTKVFPERYSFQQKRFDLAKSTVTTLENERHRIAESLHNGLAQNLYGLRIALDEVSSRTSEPATKSKLTFIRQLLEETIQENRRISHELMPPQLEKYGLAEALRDCCSRMNGSIRFRCRINGTLSHLEGYLQLTIYRIVQELSLNVVKHSHSSEAVVEVNVRQASVVIRVSDNGIGLTEQNGKRTGVGLDTIEDTVRLFRGKLAIAPRVNGGTEVKISMPF